MKKIVMLLAVLALVSMSALAATNQITTNCEGPPVMSAENTFGIKITTPVSHDATIITETAVTAADTRSANASQNWVADVAARNRTNNSDVLLAVDRSPEPVPFIRTAAAVANGADRTVQPDSAHAQRHLTNKHAAGQLDIDMHGFVPVYIKMAHARGQLRGDMRGFTNEMNAIPDEAQIAHSRTRETATDFNDIFADHSNTRTRAPAAIVANELLPYCGAV